MIPDQYMTLIRGFLNIGTGAMISAGILNSSSATTVSGAVLAIVPLAWGLFVHSPAQTMKAAEVVKEKGLAG